EDAARGIVQVGLVEDERECRKARGDLRGRHGAAARQRRGAPAHGRAPVSEADDAVERDGRGHERRGGGDEQPGAAAPAARDHSAPGRLKKTLNVASPEAARSSPGSASSASSLALRKLYEITVSPPVCEMLSSRVFFRRRFSTS